jgi:hypothetical protein
VSIKKDFDFLAKLRAMAVEGKRACKTKKEGTVTLRPQVP